ncbi:MAG: hypothetical protein KatS3mg045_0367 [Bellilinea sp.]|nr:MAG: hypothetical protein KatS3mg045_0367 [Bellilinea sp.]
MIRVVLPAHLRRLANISGEVHLDLPPPITPRRIVDEIERLYPASARHNPRCAHPTTACVCALFCLS